MTDHNLDPVAIRLRVQNLALHLEAQGWSNSQAGTLAVLTDIALAPERSPLTACEHRPMFNPADAFDGPPIVVSATLRTIDCGDCYIERVQTAGAELEAVLNQDVWCDLCGADTGFAVEHGGGTSGHGRNVGRYQLEIWTCADCEQLLPAPAAGRVPRNAPCPCGSGRKYKRCHGR